MTIDLETTSIFKDLNEVIFDDKYRYFIFEGSSRSSKTFSILQTLFLIALNNKNEDIVICMKTLADLRRTLLKKTIPNLLSMFYGMNIKYNKSEFTIYFKDTNSIISFVGLDNEDVTFGLESTYLWIDETNKIPGDTIKQLLIRNKGKVLFSYNPAGDLTVIDEYRKKENAFIHYSNYKNNPFLSDAQILEIEQLADTDYNMYLIYALGLRGVTKESIYQHFKPVVEMPINTYYNFIYGMDFGYHTNALCRIWYNITSNDIYLEEVIYSHEQSITELFEEMKEKNIEYDVTIVADSASPAIIKDIKKMGYSVIAADKGPGSVLDGINLIKTLKMTYNINSLNISNELVLYKWIKKNGKITNTPAKEFDHACFTGETLIKTHLGDVRIDEITTEHKVLTSSGYNNVLNVFDNGIKNINTYRLNFLSGESIQLNVTPNHLIKLQINNNILWKEIEEINTLINKIISVKKDTSMLINMETINKNTMHTSMEKDSFVMKNIGILNNIEHICTIMYGNTITEKELKECTYIILMEILGITTSKISKKSVVKNIYRITHRKESKIIRKHLKGFMKQVSKLQKNSIKVMKEENGTNNMLNKYGKRHQSQHTHVFNAIKSLNLNRQKLWVQNSVMEHVNQDIVKFIIGLILNVETVELFLTNGNTIRKESVVASNVLENTTERVYDIEVENTHEYFANNVLVHNCDSFRYAISYLKKTNKINQNKNKKSNKFFKV